MPNAAESGADGKHAGCNHQQRDMAKKLKITQTKSVIDSPKKQRLTMEALGIRRMHQTVVHDDTPQIRGMIGKVQHLVEVTDADE